jgi:hypothetical protein
MAKTDTTTVFSAAAANAGPLSPAYVRHVADAIFTPGPVRDFVKSAFADGERQMNSLDELLGALRGFFAQNLADNMRGADMGGLDSEILTQAHRLDEFERHFSVDVYRYRPDTKPNPDAVFWPKPTHTKFPRSLFDTLPYVAPVPLLDKHTPIGSAGSCFASEIAYYLQNQGFNYVVTEQHPRDEDIPESSARWGILFNTPSFTQLAEKAFGLRDMPRLAEYHQAGFWQDPFRENIPFGSVEELDADREPHIDACRAALEQCRVLIVTLGLNECWEFLPDGSVASRNPKSKEHVALFRHRMLTVAENLAYLQRFLDVLRTHNPDLTLIVTVSPVPFMATGLADEKHVVVANAHSKAVLRVVADEFVAANEKVHYFPSYEMVMHCLEDPWEADQRHVRRDAVARIMSLFEQMFVIGDV